MQRREFLQLAKTFEPSRHIVAGWYLSEKLDGCRAFWDGGVTRGLPTTDVPWASVTDPKTGNPKAKVKPVATGLWSRYGNPIMAPDWFLDRLPPVLLDGELFAGRGQFQTCRSIVSRDVPDDRWSQIRYMVYGSPSPDRVFTDGEIKNSNMHEVIDFEACYELVADRASELGVFTTDTTDDFDGELALIYAHLENRRGRVEYPNTIIVRQHQIPIDPDKVVSFIDEKLDGFLNLGGEGVMLRCPNAYWHPKRVASLLKYKPFLDDEAVIVGRVAGREGKQGNLLGKIGALLVSWNGIEFEIGTGFSHAERELDFVSHTAWACEHPGERIPDEFKGVHFNVGDTLTFKFRETTDAGVPKEARYWRKYE